MPRIFRDKDGVEIPQGVPFERDGLAFAANWLSLASAEDLAERSIEVAIEPDNEPPAPTAVPEPTPTEKLAAPGILVDNQKALLP